MPEYTFNEADCRKWLKNPNVNPKTGRPINPQAKKGVYQDLSVQCEKFGLTPVRGPEPESSASGISNSASGTSNSASGTSNSASGTSNSGHETQKRELVVTKTPAQLWSALSREEVISLAERILDEEPKAIEEAIALNKEYCQKKKSINELFERWRKEGQLSKDDELIISAEFLGRFCRCIQEIKTQQEQERKRLEKELKDSSKTPEAREQAKKDLATLTGLAFGSCQKSIYNTRGLKGVATRGPDKVECDDKLARAQNVIKKVAKC